MVGYVSCKRSEVSNLMEHDGMPCTSEIMMRHREKLLLYRENLRTNLTGGSFPKSILKHQQVEPEFLQAPAFAMGVDLQRRELRHEFNGPGEERWDYTVFGSVKWSNTVLL